MWGSQAWRQWKIGTGLAGSCFEWQRDSPGTWQSAQAYFMDTLLGKHCQTNWYEGNGGDLGRQDHFPTFEGPAPALLGFDEAIDHYCHAAGGHGGHARACISASLNILSLYGTRLPYNICRNFEWQAAPLTRPHFTPPFIASARS